MKSWCKNLLAVGLSVALMSACSSSDVEEEPVSELVDIQATVFPEITWDTSVGDGVGDYYSQLRPTVRYGKVFVADRSGIVVAFDETTGDELWKKDFNDVFEDKLETKTKGILLAAGVTAARNKVFVGGETGLLVALDEATGDVVWSAQANGELLSAPTVAEDVVAVNTSKGAFEAFDIDNGKKLWTYEMQLPNLTLRGTGSAAYEAGGFFLGTADGKVAVVVKSNGQAAWEQAVFSPTGANEFTRMADIDMTPLILGENLYVASYNGNLVSMELRSGRVVWSRKYSSFNDLAAAGISLYLVDDHSRIYSVDRRNGLELWSTSVLKNRELTAPAVIDNYIVVGDFEGYLHFIDRNSGDIVGRVQVDSDGLYAQPLVVGDKIYVQGRSGKVAIVTLNKEEQMNVEEDTETDAE
ncbi:MULTISPECIES: outer membrane protein assembly factor BamB [unclassified Shewanella]|jgi:outer membrane protein assembly factor BamB|uniref:outer membrane protein assembly factor BamB n=2 Tax=Gammaproteobacteria TaxID=1236 RepID=UPI000C348755|nr:MULTISPECIES: outer membrane protein assembly factor BamB [unclassified Shewanella]MBO1894669.1 outer membrane protein assembly factor BamB [Shewanella sp. BF02_Schw]PKH33259.1 outer membrane protein assembly factor BamB [Shewanella sp. ALD9]QHS12726.1 outer membrane protein assembly factor BamB [Shewanella sp. Arc9-LZ]